MKIHFHYIALLLTVFLQPLKTHSQSENFITISGNIIDKEKNEPLIGVSIGIKNTNNGTITDLQGRFSLKTKNSFPFFLIVVAEGYKTQEFEIRKKNKKSTIALNFDASSHALTPQVRNQFVEIEN